MARLPVYTSQVGIQPASAPSIPDQGAVGRALSGAGNAIQGLGGQLTDLDARGLEVQHRLAQRQKQETAFDDDNKFSLYKQTRQNAYQTAKQNMPAEATGFASSWAKGNEKPNADFLATISPANRDKIAGQLRTFDEDMLGDASKDEYNGRATYETNSINQKYQGYLTTIARNPDQRDAVLADVNDQIDKASSLTAQTKVKMKQDVLNGVSYADFQARYGSDPDGAKKALGRGNTTPVKVPSTQIAASITAAAAQLGTTPQDLATVISYESGFSTSRWGGKNNDYLGLIQFGREERKQFGVHEGQSFEEQMGSVVKFLQARGFKPGMGILDLYSTINAGSPGHYEASDGNGTVRSHVAKMVAAQGGRVKAILGGTADDVDINFGGSGATTPDARYSSLTLDQQNSLIDSAERERKQIDAANAASIQRQFLSLQNTLQNQLQDGQAGMPEINQARQQGWLSDADTVSKFTKIVQDRDKGIEDTRTFFDNLNSGRKSNPFDPNDKKIADAGFKALGGDIDALNTVYGSSGILPPSGVTALRGALISKDSGTVGKALTIASNALARDPNAFTAVDGGNAIENKATTFNHLVNDRGIPTGEAVRQIMEADTPEYKSKIRVNDQDLQEFRKAITPDTIAKQFSGWQLSATNPRGIPNFGSSPTQGAVMMRDYREAAEKHFKETGDADLAQKMAKSDVDKIWGVTNVFGTPTLVNFPVEKTYPGVGVDPNGSHNYVMIQATHEISKQAGQLVAPENLIIAPIPDGSTAQAYYKGQPAPYNVGYMAPDENGYMVPHMLPNPMTFDPNEGHKRAMVSVGPAIDARNVQEQSLQNDVQMERGLGMRGAEALSAPVTAREKPLGQYIPPKPLPKPFSQSAPPTSGNDAFQKTKEEFEQRPNILPGGLGLGM